MESEENKNRYRFQAKVLQTFELKRLPQHVSLIHMQRQYFETEISLQSTVESEQVKALSKKLGHQLIIVSVITTTRLHLSERNQFMIFQ